VARPQWIALVALEQVGHGAVEQVDVGATDADTFDVDDDLAAVGCGGLDVDDAGVPRTADDECAHDDIMAA
jgi:hypothetical protein